ncbi:MAG: Smr/MutS family protein [Acutalibacteraceae bacterium]
MSVLSNRSQTTIIHGGTGALRAGVQEHLRHHPYVKPSVWAHTAKAMRA